MFCGESELEKTRLADRILFFFILFYLFLDNLRWWSFHKYIRLIFLYNKAVGYAINFDDNCLQNDKESCVTQLGHQLSNTLYMTNTCHWACLYIWICVYIYVWIVRENQFNLVKVWRRHREWKLVQLAAKSTRSLQEIYFRAREPIDDGDDEDEDEEGGRAAGFQRRSVPRDTCMNISTGETRADVAR